MSTQFVTNEKGKKIAAIVPIQEYEDLLQDISSAAIIERRRNEETRPWEDLKRNFIKMESYRIDYAKGVEKDFSKIPKKTADRIARAIDKLGTNPRPVSSVKLVGYDIEYRIRVGDYRVIYQIHDSVLVVLVIEVGHRKNIYRK